jgi:hypothetical protein
MHHGIRAALASVDEPKKQAEEKRKAEAKPHDDGLPLLPVEPLSRSVEARIPLDVSGNTRQVLDPIVRLDEDVPSLASSPARRSSPMISSGRVLTDRRVQGIKEGGRKQAVQRELMMLPLRL